MKNKKTAMFSTLLILALSMISFAYALWSETLTLSGTIATGEVDWEFTGVLYTDAQGPDYHCNPGFIPNPAGLIFWQGVKDVGSTWAEVTDPHTVTIILDNVYPCYFTQISVYTKATGTIPLIFDSLIIDGVIIRDDPSPVVELDLDGDGLNDIEILWGNGFGEQRHPGESFPEMSFWIHVLQEAPQGKTLSFTMELVAVQYNEYIPP